MTTGAIMAILTGLLSLIEKFLNKPAEKPTLSDYRKRREGIYKK